MEAPPYKVCFDERLGRHLVATQPIKSTTIILKEPPLIKGPFLQTYPVCVGCGKILDTHSTPCVTCGWPLCSSSCQGIQNHEPECVLTASRGSQISIKNFGILNPNYQFVSILRGLYLKKTSPETYEELLTLQTHPIANVAPPSFIRSLFKLEDWSEDEIRKVSEILTVNGHELPLTQPSQLVVYAATSLLEHSCRANCTKTFTNEGDVLVIASEDVEQGDHLSICYTDPFWGVENRRRHLHQTKSFWCSCSRCEDPSEMDSHLNSIKCPNRACQGLVLPKTFLHDHQLWFCTKCDSIFSSDTVSLLLGKIGSELIQLPKEDPAVCQQFIRKYEKVLAPTHFYMVDVKMALGHMLASENFEDLTDSDLQLLLKITEELRMVAGRVAPAERRFMGLLLYRLAKTKVEMARRGDDQDHFLLVLTESRKIFSEAMLLLANEPTLLPEGRVHLQIGLELRLIDDLLEDK